MITKLFTYNKAKVVQALRYHFINRKEIKVMMIALNVFAILAAVLFFMKKIGPTAFIISSILWLVLMLMSWFIMPYMVYRGAKTFQDSFRANFGNTEFSIENDRGGRSWPWASFSHFMESPYFFHLYFDAKSFFLVPKDAFENDEIQQARIVLHEKIGKNKL